MNVVRVSMGGRYRTRGDRTMVFCIVNCALIRKYAAMDLTLPTYLGSNYLSNSQRARVITEAWAVRNLYCPACDAELLTQFPANSRAVDFHCSLCNSRYQLKATKSAIGGRINDSAYESMMSAIRNNQCPHFIIMRYDLASARVRDLLLLPSFGISESAIIARRPLAPTARRAGWVGCLIDLGYLPANARILIVQNFAVQPREHVTAKFASLRPLESHSAKSRGWALDVLTLVQTLKREEFSLSDIYASEAVLAALHTNNRNIRAKIRQQLQVLRDLGLIKFLSPGRYSLLGSVK